MLSINQLDKKIFDLEHELVPQSLDFTYIHSARIDILYWVKNSGNMKTEQDIKNKIKRYEEELLCIPNEFDLHYREKKARINELQELLKT